MTFHVGQKVVCIKHPIPHPWCRYPVFVKGSVYTVAALDDLEGEVFIAVRELHWSVFGNISGFRPVVERKTDISIFTAMLNTSKQEVSA